MIPFTSNIGLIGPGANRLVGVETGVVDVGVNDGTAGTHNPVGVNERVIALDGMKPVGVGTLCVVDPVDIIEVDGDTGVCIICCGCC